MAALRRTAAGCTACDLYRRATQTVFGEGPVDAPIVLIGEQPGNDEDVQGHPFVGPAGRLLDEALTAAGIDRTAVYVTNAVKHFKWKPKPGTKRRIHDTPTSDEMAACRPWFQQELDLIQPRVVVCLGVTAAVQVLRRRVTITGVRGKILTSADGPDVVVTIHPSAILRLPEEADREVELKRLVADLHTAARHAG
jgi:DNA polymerase